MRTLLVALLAFVVTAMAGCAPGEAPSPSPAGIGILVRGSAQAGPVCPVEPPGDPACAARPVDGATLAVVDSSGAEVIRATTAVDGSFEVRLSPGAYDLVPQPVQGLLGNAPTIHITVSAGGDVSPSPIVLEYDTGIR